MSKNYWLVTWEQSLINDSTLRYTEVSDTAPIHTLIEWRKLIISGKESKTLTLIFAMPITISQYREWNKQ